MNSESPVTPESIDLLEPAHLLIVWSDGSETLISHRELRLACQCANCVEEWSQKPLLDPDRIPADIRIERLQPTGNYGLNFTFSDRHSTGIYTFERLRQLAGR